MLLLHGFVAKQAASSCSEANLLSCIVINLQGSPIFILLTIP